MFTTTVESLPNPLIHNRNLNFLKKSHLGISSNMWRNVSKQVCKGLLRRNVNYPPLVFAQSSIFSGNKEVLCNIGKENGSGRVSKSRFQLVENFGGCCCSQFDAKGYSSVAEAVSSTDVEDERNFHNSSFRFVAERYSSVAETLSSTDAEEDDLAVIDDEIKELLEEMEREDKRKIDEFMLKNEGILHNDAEKGDSSQVDDEINELLKEMKREERRQNTGFRWHGLPEGKYKELRKRQVKIETELWQEAAREYKELLMDMCEQKLAPNLPYMKSLFLGWFEPLRDAIENEQEMYRNGKKRTAYAPYFVQLPSDKMAVITMHKMMALLMAGSEKGFVGTARVIQAVCSVGDSIEQEVRQIAFLMLFLFVCFVCTSSIINSINMLIEVVQMTQFHTYFDRETPLENSRVSVGSLRGIKGEERLVFQVGKDIHTW